MEVLGFNSSRLSSRPSVLKGSRQVKPFLNWAKEDRVRSMTFLCRSRPMRGLYVGFYDGSEILRGISLAETVKASDTTSEIAAI